MPQSKGKIIESSLNNKRKSFSDTFRLYYDILLKSKRNIIFPSFFSRETLRKEPAQDSIQISQVSKIQEGEENILESDHIQSSTFQSRGKASLSIALHSQYENDNERKIKEINSSFADDDDKRKKGSDNFGIRDYKNSRFFEESSANDSKRDVLKDKYSSFQTSFQETFYEQEEINKVKMAEIEGEIMKREDHFQEKKIEKGQGNSYVKISTKDSQKIRLGRGNRSSFRKTTSIDANQAISASALKNNTIHIDQEVVLQGNYHDPTLKSEDLNIVHFPQSIIKKDSQKQFPLQSQQTGYSRTYIQRQINQLNQDDQEQEEEFISFGKKDFNIEYLKGVLLLSKNKGVTRKITIGSYMEGDDVYVILNISKDLDKKLKVNELRELLSQYETLYKDSLKILKTLCHEAYLDTPMIITEGSILHQQNQNEMEIRTKQNSLHLQLKIIVNKIENLKDLLHLQNRGLISSQSEEIDLPLLLNELKKDFLPLLEEKNSSIELKISEEIKAIINSPKRVKQVLFNILHSFICEKKLFSGNINIQGSHISTINSISFHQYDGILTYHFFQSIEHEYDRNALTCNFCFFKQDEKEESQQKENLFIVNRSESVQQAAKFYWPKKEYENENCRWNSSIKILRLCRCLRSAKSELTLIK